MPADVYTEEERRIWQAAYGAAFAGEIYRAYFIGMQCRKPGGFDCVYDFAFNRASAEIAICAADLSVAKLRKWRDRENSKAGTEMGMVDEEWMK